MDEKKFRKVNASLDKDPHIGPFPAELIFPVAGGAIFSYLVCVVFLNLGLPVAGILWFTIVTTYWILIARGTIHFFGRMYSPPKYLNYKTRYLNPLVEADLKEHHRGGTKKDSSKSQGRNGSRRGR